MANTIQFFRGLKAKLTSLLAVGEPYFATDTNELLIGTSNGNVNINGSLWYTGTEISGTSTTVGAYSYSACPLVKVGDIYLNTSTSYIYQCTTAGSGTSAKWTYKGSIKGAEGEMGPIGDDGQRGSQWFSGTAMSGTSTTTGAYTWSDSTYKYVGDYYLNTTYGYVYRCTTEGSGTTAKWTYQGSIRGVAGSNATITGGASTIASTNLTVNRALISNASGKVAVSTITSTELGYLSGVKNKIVSTTTGYNTKIHVSATEPTMSTGDIWLKIPS